MDWEVPLTEVTVTEDDVEAVSGGRRHHVRHPRQGRPNRSAGRLGEVAACEREARVLQHELGAAVRVIGLAAVIVFAAACSSGSTGSTSSPP